MTQTCHPIPQAVAHHMVQGLVEMICDRPGQTAERREARATEVVHSVLAFQPRDPVEMMLAGMVVTHFHLLSHTAHDAFCTRPEDLKPRATSGIVALGRAIVGFAKELRVAQQRPMAGATEALATAESVDTPENDVAARQPPAPVQQPDPVAAERRDAVAAVPPRRTGSSSAAMMAVLSPASRLSAAKSGSKSFAAVANTLGIGETQVPAGVMPGGRLPGLPGAPTAATSRDLRGPATIT